MSGTCQLVLTATTVIMMAITAPLIPQIEAFAMTTSFVRSSTPLLQQKGFSGNNNLKQRHNLQMSSNEGNTFTGKVVAQRYLYRLSPTQSTVTSPYTIEERQYFIVGEDRGLEPIGDKCFFLRKQDVEQESNAEPPPEQLKKNGQPRLYTTVGGPSVYQIKNVAEVDEDDEDTESAGGGLGATIWDSSHVMTLYCMANPGLIKGNVLELGSGVGIGGLLSTIGAGVAIGDTSSTDGNDADALVTPKPKYQSIEDIAMEPVVEKVQEEEDEGGDELSLKKKNAPVPPLLKRLSLTDSNIPTLNKALTNVQKSSFPSSKIDVAQLDWGARVPNEKRGIFDCILACDCAYYFPIVKPLARTVAYSLQISPYDKVDNVQQIGGTFIHIGPEHRESIQDLRIKLSRGYRMTTRSESLVMERFDLAPLIMDSLAQEMNQMEDEAASIYVEYQNKEVKMFESLVAYHNEDYNGFNGEQFFPVETGREDSYGSDGMETDFGYGTSGGGGSGGGRGGSTPWLG